ncbi:ribosome maturation factor [Weissella kandleri]|uniref:ribosome maturation factor n=1 Tax=Weissella kandleri TaxID=1616 RepID=UPI00387E9FA8
MDIIDQVKATLAPALAARGFLLWDVEYETMDSEMVLRTLIDREKGQISIDDLVELTDLVGELVDEIEPDPFPASYMLDVASPGAERSLKQVSDYQWALSKNIEIDLKQPIDGSSKLIGNLMEVLTDGIIVEYAVKAKRQKLTITFDQIQAAKMALNQNRDLVSDEDLAWAQNKLVQVKTYQKINGLKEFAGELVDFDEQTLVIADEEGHTLEVPRNAIAKAKQVSI